METNCRVYGERIEEINLYLERLNSFEEKLDRDLADLRNELLIHKFELSLYRDFFSVDKNVEKYRVRVNRKDDNAFGIRLLNIRKKEFIEADADTFLRGHNIYNESLLSELVERPEKMVFMKVDMIGEKNRLLGENEVRLYGRGRGEGNGEE